MAELHRLIEQKLADRKITPDEVAALEEYFVRDGKLDMHDVKFLVELMAGADEVCPEFEELFFPVLKHVLLEDGKIDDAENFYLLKLIYGNGEIRDREKQFLEELRHEITVPSPAFEALCDEAFDADPTSWDVGGE